MAEPVLKFPPDQGRSPARRRRSQPSRRRAARAASPHPAAGGAADPRARRRRDVLSVGRALRHHRRRLCRRAEGPDHAGRLRQDPEGGGASEGQHVKARDELFEIDPVPYRMAVQQAEAALETAKTNYQQPEDQLPGLSQMLDLAQQGVELKQRDVERKTSLVKSSFGSQLDLDNADHLAGDRAAQLEFLQQQIASTKNQLLGNPDLPLEQFPPYAQAKAALDQAAAQSRPHRAAGADRRRRDPGRFRSSSAASFPPARRCSASSTTTSRGSTPT